MQTYVELAKYATPDWKNFGWSEANDFFLQGDAAMMEQWPGLSKLAEETDSKIKGKVDKFIEFITSKDMELLKIASGNDPTRISNYKRPEVAASNPILNAIQSVIWNKACTCRGSFWRLDFSMATTIYLQSHWHDCTGYHRDLGIKSTIA